MVASPEYIHDKFKAFMSATHPCLPEAIRAEVAAKQLKRQKPDALRQWLCRWRQRWGFQYRALPNRFLIPDTEFFRKVQAARGFVFAAVQGPEVGTVGGACFRAPGPRNQAE